MVKKIEIQIRSKLQHAWATAIETCQTFTGQALKSKVKEASPAWLRFFVLMSSAIAARENRPIVSGTSLDHDDRKAELQQIERDEKFISLIQGWGAAMQHPQVTNDNKSVVFLMELDVSQKMLRMEPFQEKDMLIAQARYLEREKATETNPNVQVVLVSADSVSALRRAYPNYYVDTAAFIDAIRREIN